MSDVEPFGQPPTRMDDVIANPDRGYWPEPDPVDAFVLDVEEALRQLRVEVAALRAERDGLRLAVEGLRARLAIAQEHRPARDGMSETVRELRLAIERFSSAPPRLDPAPPPVVEELEPAPAPAPAPAPEEPSGLLWDPERAPAVPAQFAGDAIQSRAEPAIGEPLEIEIPKQRSLAHRIGVAVLLALSTVVVLVVLAATVGPKLLPYQTFYVRSGSMAPTIDTGAMVVLTETDASDLDVDDIITFENPERPGTLVTHRIVDVEGTGDGRVFVTKGDANGAPDSWRVPATGTGWRYLFHVPKLGFVFGHLSTGLARILLVVVPAAILLLLALPDLWGRRGKRRASA